MEGGSHVFLERMPAVGVKVNSSSYFDSCTLHAEG